MDRFQKCAFLFFLLRTLTTTVPGWTTALDGGTTATSSSSCCRWPSTWWEFSPSASSLSSTTERDWEHCTPLSRILSLLETSLQSLLLFGNGQFWPVIYYYFRMFHGKESIELQLIVLLSTSIAVVKLDRGVQSGCDVYRRAFLHSGHGTHRFPYGARSQRSNHQRTGEHFSKRNTHIFLIFIQWKSTKLLHTHRCEHSHLELPDCWHLGLLPGHLWNSLRKLLSTPLLTTLMV